MVAVQYFTEKSDQVADVSSGDEPEKAMDRIRWDSGELDVLANNGGEEWKEGR